MNRVSRGSAPEALLEVGRTEPVLRYDVELGLARHHHWLRSEAPMPEWAGASVDIAAKSFAPVVIKTIVSAVLVGALAAAAWHARGRPQPSAADVNRSSPGAERTRAVAPSIRDVTASEARMAHTPMPLSDEGLANDQPVRADVPNKRTTRVQRAHKQQASARPASARAEPRSAGDAQSPGTVARASVAPDAAAARVAPAASTTTVPSEDVSAERASPREVAAASERKPISAAHRARPEPLAQVQEPEDLLEMQQVASAEQLLERSPERALALVRQGDQRFARGYFQQERAYIAIMALIRLGRIGDARARAASFAKQFPPLPYGARIRSALEAREGAAPSAASRDVAP
jgi:hypothetical protein